MKAVKSSVASHCGYNPATGTMTVKFNNGSTYTYPNIPDKVHASLMSAESFGKYFTKHIVGKFKHG